MAEVGTYQRHEDDTTWNVGYKKYGKTIIRYCTSEYADPTVLIEKYALEKPWLMHLIAGIDINQRHFGFDYLEDRSFVIPAEDQAFLDYYQKNQLCTTLESVAVISCPTTNNTPPELGTPNSNVSDSAQLTLF